MTRRRRGLRSTAKRATTAVALVGGIVAFAVPSMRRSISDRVSRDYDRFIGTVVYHYEPLAVTGATSTSAQAGHPASLAIDRTSNTYWATGPANDGKGAVLHISIPSSDDPVRSPVTVDVIVLTIGANPAFASEPRPRVLQFAFSDGTVFEVGPLKDTDAPQSIKLPRHAVNPTSVDITIEEVVQSSDGAGHNCAIAEVELQQRKPGK
jgi:hypothetical protein